LQIRNLNPGKEELPFAKPGIDPVRGQTVVKGMHGFGIAMGVGEEDIEKAIEFSHLLISP
jgi:hypothetical protein